MGSKTFVLLFVLSFAAVLLMNSEMAAARELANVSTYSKENREYTTTPKGWVLRTTGSKKLRIAVPVNNGFKDLVNVEHDPQNNVTTFTGFCIDVFSAAIQALPYEVCYEFIKTDTNINDLINQVSIQNFDAIVGDTTILASRSIHVDFTSPYTDLGVGTVARIDNKDTWFFLKPFDVYLWLTCAALFILTGLVVWVLEHQNENYETSQQTVRFTLSTVCFANGEKLSSNLSRFVVIIWLFVLFILTSSYTATLASLLTVQQFKLASKGDIVGFHRGSVVQGLTVNNLNFDDYRLKPYSSIDEYADALSRGSKNGGAAAIVDEIPYIKMFLAKYSDEYAMISSESISSGFGFVFQKGSPLVPDISREISKLREDGKLRDMEKKWFENKSYLSSQDSVTKIEILKFDHFRGLFLIAGISSALALLISVIYLLWEKLQVYNYIIRLLDGGKLMAIMRYLLNRNANGIQETDARQRM